MKKRLVFVDLLRGWAMLVMVEVHVFNAFLIPAFKETGWFQVLNFINGLVAPAFLFVSGFVFVLGGERKVEDFRKFGRAFWKQIGRIALIWGIGYGLHIPFYSLSRTLTETSEIGWLKFYQVDILHCIAVGLLLLMLVRIVVHSEQRHRWVLIGGTLGFALIAPFIWEIDFNLYLRAWLVAYLNGEHYSIFPLFPWLAFMLAGGVAALHFMRLRDAEQLGVYLRSVSMSGVGFVVLGLVVLLRPFSVPFWSSSLRADPFFFALRLGIVLVLLGLCYWYEQRRQTEQSFVLDASRESLLVYAAHLLVIYGTFWNDWSLADLYGKSFTVPESLVATLALTLLIIILAKGWGWLKGYCLLMSRGFAYGTGAVVVVLFLIKG